MSSPRWLNVHFAGLVGADIDRLTESLERAGALSVTIVPAGHVFDEPPSHAGDPGPPAPAVADVIALMDADIDAAHWLRALADEFGRIPEHSVDGVTDRDWTLAWRDTAGPMPFGDRLCVAPTHAVAEHAGQTVVRLDAGCAFGTGRHETTALCLTALTEHVFPDRAPLVIDYGCGSGILAIAAIKLGAAHARAVDIDRRALQVAAENAALNDVAADITFHHANDPTTLPPADLLVANILLAPLLELAPTLLALLRPHGTLILSGLLRSQTDQCIDRYSGSVTFHPPRLSGDWACLVGQKRSGSPRAD